MESTSQRYATFLRQWKKRHSYSQLHNHYHKYERLPKCDNKGNRRSRFGVDDFKKRSAENDLKKGSAVNNLKQGFPMNEFERVSSSSLPDKKEFQPLANSHITHKKEKLSSIESDIWRHFDIAPKEKELNNVTKKSPPRLSYQEQTQSERPPPVHPQSLPNLRQKKPKRIEEISNVKKCLKTNHGKGASPPFLSSAELADMEFWLMYGESAQSAASHFSYALLARIDQLPDIPVGNGYRSRTLKTTVQQKTIPHNQSEWNQSNFYDGLSFDNPTTGENGGRQKDRSDTKRRKSSVYWNHDSDCADKYRLHILKVMKSTNQPHRKKEKSETVADSQILVDKNVEKAVIENGSGNGERTKSNSIAAKSNSKELSKEDLQKKESSTFGDRCDGNPQKVSNPVPKSSASRNLLIASKVQLNPSKTVADNDKLPREKVASTSSLIAIPSTASTRAKLDREHSSSNACVPSAGSSVTVYLPRCPLETDTASISEENSERQKKTEYSKRHVLHKEQIEHELSDEIKFNVNLNEEASRNNTDGDEKQDVISVSIRLHNICRQGQAQSNATSENFGDKLQRLNSVSGLDSSRKCNQWLNEKCPKQ